MESYSLLELNQCIGQQLKNVMPDLYWVVAEINELQVNGAGHCFMELVEKAPQSGNIIAKARANIWAYHYRMLSPYFETMTGQRLVAGLKVMMQASVEFHELYGLSLHVVDINPAFTVGDLAIQRQAVIQQLVDEGVIDMNRELELPPVPQRIAVISSETAAGYGDFINQLHNNPHGYAFQHTLFQAIVQGVEAERSIIGAFEQVFEREEEFDVVVLIRGGGSQSDLNCFNSYWLAACIAQFPLPVITGIGHERDETVADMVSCVPLKTPTAVAEFLIHRAITLDKMLLDLAGRLSDTAEFIIRESSYKLQQQSQRLLNIIHSHVRIQDREIHLLHIRLENATRYLILHEKQKHEGIAANLQKVSAMFLHEQKSTIQKLEDKLQLLDPVNLLRRGYSITRANGKAVRNAKILEKGQIIETTLHDGIIESIIN